MAAVPFTMAEETFYLQVIAADESLNVNKIPLARPNLLSLHGCRQALRTSVKSDSDACVRGARHSLLRACERLMLTLLTSLQADV